MPKSRRNSSRIEIISWVVDPPRTAIFLSMRASAEVSSSRRIDLRFLSMVWGLKG